ncbi:hypothetical protein [Streptomyces sp. NBC_00588]|uniref:hypothetical protein n=1 Tax=Streptomyces sp. NBC_00588 TaxID=2975784 RepID=UPI002E81B9BD|nr:hypothetical protein [Streptomyces sp. NBC_00588]WUB34143.1 hypothetical protein OHN38_04205 [Streptomyces sp. NBC_00588]
MPPSDSASDGFAVLEETARTWRPDDVRTTDPLDPAPAAALSAVLDLPAPAAADGEPLPPLWHWLYFLSWPRRSALGADGHPRDSGFLPPLPQRRRMFAGGRLEVAAPLTAGRPAQQHSRVSRVVPKRGRSGNLLFVTVRSEYRQDGRLCLTEEQDLVYRSGGAPPVPPAAALDTESRPSAGTSPWQQEWRTDPALLFRFSALTANAHRIHYDTPYTTGVEGYPGLVVHGPLLVLAMLELVRREQPDRPVRTLSYRLNRPAFCGERLLACGGPEPGGGPDDTVRLRIASHREDAHAGADVGFA